MKKKNLIIVFSGIFLIFLFTLVIKYAPFSTSKYLINEDNINLTIPGLSFFSKKCCNTTITFKSIRSVESIEHSINTILKNYESISCDNNNYYYNKNDNYTITDYEIKHGILFNEYYYTYNPGNYCDSMKQYECVFIKTYLVEKITESDDNNYIYITLKQFQVDDVATVKILKSLGENIIELESYEFKFQSINKNFDDNILSIFDNAEVLEISKTDLIGIEQIQESICK